MFMGPTSSSETKGQQVQMMPNKVGGAVGLEVLVEDRSEVRVDLVCLWSCALASRAGDNVNFFQHTEGTALV